MTKFEKLSNESTNELKGERGILLPRKKSFKIEILTPPPFLVKSHQKSLYPSPLGFLTRVYQ